MPINTLDAHAAPDLGIQVETRDERHDLLCLSSDHKGFFDYLVVILFLSLCSSKLDLRLLFDIADNVRLNFLAERNDCVEAALAPSVENVAMRVTDKGEFLAELAVS